MSKQTKRRFLQLLVLIVVAGALGFAVAATSKSPQREIVLVVRDMAFFAPGEPAPNPTLTVGIGENMSGRRFADTVQDALPGVFEDCIFLLESYFLHESPFLRIGEDEFYQSALKMVLKQ